MKPLTREEVTFPHPGMHPYDSRRVLALLDRCEAAERDEHSAVERGNRLAGQVSALTMALVRLDPFHSALAADVVGVAASHDAARTPWASGLCSAHQVPDPLCTTCHHALASHDAAIRAAALEEAAQAIAIAFDDDEDVAAIDVVRALAEKKPEGT